MDNRFVKPPISIGEQIKLLEKRGMLIDDFDKASKFLEFFSYYRFCGFALHFEQLTPKGERIHQYKINTSFDKVIDLINFDTSLRKIVFHYIAIIEVAFRATLTNETSIFYNDPHWYLDENKFTFEDDHSNFIKLCIQEYGRSNEIFVKSYKEHYSSPELPPIWMQAELMPFTTLSRLYQNTKDNKLKDKIARKWNNSPLYISSWLSSLSVLRNHCAHHSRIWNRNFKIAPKLKNSMKKKIYKGSSKKIITLLLVIYDMLKVINYHENFKDEIQALANKHSSIEWQYLGCCSVEDIFKEQF